MAQCIVMNYRNKSEAVPLTELEEDVEDIDRCIKGGFVTKYSHA